MTYLNRIIEEETNRAEQAVANLPDKWHGTNHVCNRYECPPDGGYYVSAIDGNKYWLMSGPYLTHGQALQDVRKVRELCEKHDSKAVWMAWGTCRVKDRAEWKPGVLQARGLMQMSQTDYFANEENRRNYDRARAEGGV